MDVKREQNAGQGFQNVDADINHNNARMYEIAKQANQGLVDPNTVGMEADDNSPIGAVLGGKGTGEPKAGEGLMIDDNQAFGGESKQERQARKRRRGHDAMGMPLGYHAKVKQHKDEQRNRARAMRGLAPKQKNPLLQGNTGVNSFSGQKKTVKRPKTWRLRDIQLMGQRGLGGPMIKKLNDGVTELNRVKEAPKVERIKNGLERNMESVKVAGQQVSDQLAQQVQSQPKAVQRKVLKSVMPKKRVDKLTRPKRSAPRGPHAAEQRSGRVLLTKKAIGMTAQPEQKKAAPGISLQKKPLQTLG